MTLVVVCGLAAEAKIARSPSVKVLVGGGDRVRLARELEQSAPEARALLSFGLAGGLSPGLRPGAIRVAQAVDLPSGKRVPTDEAWTAALARRLDAPVGVIAGRDAPVASAAAKAALHVETGAAAVDMESHLVAQAAAAHEVPFAVLRVITDTAERSLPHAATIGMRADGQVDLAAILRSLGRDPRQLPGLIRTGLDARVAFAALLRCRQNLGAAFALLDLA